MRVRSFGFCFLSFIFLLVVVSPSAPPAWASDDDPAAVEITAAETDAKTTAGVPSKPNVVLFFIDDLGYTDLGCYGSETYETPRIDELAAQGVRFTNFYSANPVCSPTRAALMTGKAPQRVGITQWISQPGDVHLPLEEVTIGEALVAQGYQCGYLGKWHLGEADEYQPSKQGFAWTRGVNRAGQPGSYFFPFKRKKGKQRNGDKAAASYWDVPDLEEAAEGDYLTDRLTDQALEFITTNQQNQQPFFLCFSHYAVHTPIQSPVALVDKYEKKLGDAPLSEPIAERNNGLTRSQQDNPDYGAMVENLDMNVGRVLDHLQKLSLSKNTLVLFTSDNGGLSTLKNKPGPTSCRPLRAGKGWTYEGGIRVPTIAVWPEKIQPGVVSTPGITMDIYPTLLEMLGLPAMSQQHLDGNSLASAIAGQPNDQLATRFLAWTYPHEHGSQHTPSNAIRAGDWKLIHLIDEGRKPEEEYELYNLKNDIGETKNLALEKPHKTKVMAQRLQQWVSSTQPIPVAK